MTEESDGLEHPGRPDLLAMAERSPGGGARVSRRRLGWLAWLSLLPLGGLWRSMVRAHGDRLRAPRRYLFRGPLPEGLTVEGPVALWRDGSSITAVSRRCPHLGCTVRASPDGALACPCHGSRFDAHGHVERGPAQADLTRLRIALGDDGKGWIVDVPS